MGDYEILSMPSRGGVARTRVLVGGQGYPLVWLHGGAGLSGWEPQLAALAQHFTVYAPVHPGLGDERELAHLENLWDLTLHYCDLLDALVLESPFVLGHGYGGMLAAEIAATAPDRVAKLVLVSPLGLWREDAPIVGEAVVGAGAAGPAGVGPAGVGPVERSGAAMGKFCLPLSGCSLARHMYRVCARTLLVWGGRDEVVPPAYAGEFARHLPGARVAMFEGSGHVPHLEEPERFGEVVTRFLREG